MLGQCGTSVTFANCTVSPEAAERQHLMDLVRESKQQGWWQTYNLPYSTYIGLEADAASIKDYHCTVVPGLLQTAEYARAMYSTVTGLEREVMEQHVEARLLRQRRITEAHRRADCHEGATGTVD